MIVVLALSVCIGLSLGLMGGGGSILAVPVLKYAAALDAKTAIATSLVVVGTTAGVGGVRHALNGNVAWRTGAIFAATTMAGAYAGGRTASRINGTVLLVAFSAMMLLTAVMMLRGRSNASPRQTPIPVVWVTVQGLGVGFATGLVGAGGGFLIVPALVLLGGMEMHRAVGTSLMVITLKSYAAFGGYLSHVSIDVALTTSVTAAAVVGTLVGTQFAASVSATHLRKAFAVFVVVMAALILWQEVGVAFALLFAGPIALWMGWRLRNG